MEFLHSRANLYMSRIGFFRRCARSTGQSTHPLEWEPVLLRKDPSSEVVAKILCIRCSQTDEPYFESRQRNPEKVESRIDRLVSFSRCWSKTFIDWGSKPILQRDTFILLGSSNSSYSKNRTIDTSRCVQQLQIDIESASAPRNIMSMKDQIMLAESLLCQPR